MSDVTQQIKEKIDIVDFLKSYIQLLPAGRNFKALCPFHKEKTPSFMVSPEKMTWHCFGSCNEGGDIFSFLMKYENLDFYEALQVLAEKVGIDIRKTSNSISDYKQYGVLYEINEKAKEFFKTNLNDLSLSYCHGRGLSKGTIEEFELGFSPNFSDQLLRYLLNNGFNVNEIEGTGLVFKTERGTYWDRFRGRIMFPLYNSFGKIVGFTGRILPNEANEANTINIAKYINSPETLIFNKSKILYGLHKSKNAIKEASAVLLVEGQMDFLMSYQIGVKNVVATSGTAFTPDHFKMIRRFTDQIIVGFDNDVAGQNATERVIDLALQQDFFVKVIFLSGKDPAEIAQANPDLLKQLIVSAKSAKDFYFNHYLPENLDTHQTKKGVRQILSKIKRIASLVDQSYWIKDLSTKTGVDEKSLILEMEKLTTASVSSFSNKTASSTEPLEDWTRKQLVVQRILDLGGALELSALFPEILQRPVSLLLSMKGSLENSKLLPEEIKKEREQLIKQLKIELCKEKITLLKNDIVNAERTKDTNSLNNYLKEFDNTIRQLHNIMDEKEGGQISQEKNNWEEKKS